MVPRKYVFVVVAAIGFLFACGVTTAAPPLRAQHALGIQRVLVLAVSFPDVPTLPPLGVLKRRMLDGPESIFHRNPTARLNFKVMLRVGSSYLAHCLNTS